VFAYWSVKLLKNKEIKKDIKQELREKIKQELKARLSLLLIYSTLKYDYLAYIFINLQSVIPDLYS